MPESAKLIVTIVERGQGRSVQKLYTSRQAPWHYRSIGQGTASSELLDVLGLGGSERDVILTLASRSAAERLMRLLKEDRPESLEAKGLVFDMPLTGLNNIVAAALERQGRQTAMETGGLPMARDADNSLILFIVNQGHTDDVMNTARAAGARGGTVLRSRYAAEEDIGRFYGISVQEEKEILLIVASGGTRNAIMETVNKKHGLKTPAGAVILSLPLDHVVRL